jgi:hypothetical protein
MRDGERGDGHRQLIGTSSRFPPSPAATSRPPDLCRQATNDTTQKTHLAMFRVRWQGWSLQCCRGDTRTESGPGQQKAGGSRPTRPRAERHSLELERGGESHAEESGRDGKRDTRGGVVVGGAPTSRGSLPKRKLVPSPARSLRLSDSSGTPPERSRVNKSRGSILSLIQRRGCNNRSRICSGTQGLSDTLLSLPVCGGQSGQERPSSTLAKDEADVLTLNFRNILMSEPEQTVLALQLFGRAFRWYHLLLGFSSN